MKYYLIDYKSDGAEVDKKWYQENILRFPCRHYDYYNKFYDPITIQYLDLSCVYGTIHALNVRYFRIDFLETINNVMNQDITKMDNVLLGNLIDNKTDKILGEWKTFWMPSAIYLRGSSNVRYWKCKTCGQITYNSDIQGRYLVEADIQERPLILAGDFLFIRDDIFDKLQSLPTWQKMKQNILFEKINVLKTPLDGFPEKLSQYEPPVLVPEDVYREDWVKAQKIQQERQTKRKQQVLNPPIELAKKNKENEQQWENDLDVLMKQIKEKLNPPE
jgi:hypothetical protein